jgi:hypothetical protein
MRAGTALRELGRFLEACESRDGVVTEVCFAECVDPANDRQASAEVTLRLDVADGGAPLRATGVDGDGTVRFALEPTSAVPSPGEYDVAVEPAGATIEPGGAVTVRLTATVPADAADGDAPERTRDREGEATDGTATVARADGRGPARPDETGVSDTQVAAARSEPGGETLSERSTGGDRSAATEDPAADAADESSTGPSGDRNLPPFRDTELLREVYEDCDTFAEMVDAIGMDVTAETVRRYMIDHGIHRPDSYDTGDDTAGNDSARDAVRNGDGANAAGEGSPNGDGRARADERLTGDGNRTSHAGAGADGRPDGNGVSRAEGDASTTEGDASTTDEPAVDGEMPVVVSDGIGLPEEVTVDTLVETVKRSNTLYEVTQDIDIDRHDALELLQELNLLDLVVGRLSAETKRDISREEVVDRLREASAIQ